MEFKLNSRNKNSLALWLPSIFNGLLIDNTNNDFILPIVKNMCTHCQFNNEPSKSFENVIRF